MHQPCPLYYITDRTALAPDEPNRRRRLLEKISAATRAGVDYIQLREKDLPTRALESLARDAMSLIARLKAANRELRTALLINSRTDVALAVKADGVHLRSNDVSPQELRSIWKCVTGERGTAGSVAGEYGTGECGVGAPGLENLASPLIAVSCHSPTQAAQAAANGATFAVFAPVFEKKGVNPAGLDQLEKACRAKIPVLALGGITLSNAQSCLAAGAAGIAAIRLFQENDIEQIVSSLRALR